MAELEAIVRPGNSKLGLTIGKVALPALQTCPGAGQCAKVCYAIKLMQMYSSYDRFVQTHLQILENDPEGYFAQVKHDILTNGYRTVRIHESGDFYSSVQINGWAALAKAMPTVQFFAYTRSWNQATLIGTLEAFRALPNVQLLASVEANETAPLGWRTAAIVPKGTTKGSNGSVVCPEALGIKASCADCRFCIDAPKNKTVNVLFPKH